MRLYIILSIILILFIAGEAFSRDPFKEMSFHELNNGMSVVLAPSSQAKNVKVKVRVKVGTSVENENNLGVSHLLEHLLFRDSELEDGQTYLQLIKEEGGNINAYVTKDETSYQAVIPFEKGEWLLKQFATMLKNREIKSDFIEKAKSSVELETGEPGWLSRLLGFDLLGSFLFRYFPTPDFFDSEFGIKYTSYTNDEFRLSNRRLTYDQLITHYDDYYRPSNMILFVSGKFDRNKMLDLIKDEFGKQGDFPGKTVLEIIPVPNNKPYRRVYNSMWITPYINIGVKYHRLNPKEILSLNAYLEYLAHRLMKELRNKKGETYTVNVYADEKFNAGYGVISFETTHKMFNKNLNYVQSLIQNETQMGEMSDEQVIEATTFLKKQRFELADSDAETLMKYAIYYHDFKTNYGTDSSPYEVLTKLTTDEFKYGINNTFNEKNSYTTIFYPYIYSRVEKIIIFLVTIVCSIIVFRKTFRRKIDETKVRWVQNLVYSPGMFLEILVIFLLSLILYSLVNTPIKRSLYLEPWYHSLMLWPTYLFDTISTFLYIGIFTGLLSYFPKKLIIQGNDLFLKSIALYVRRIKNESIGSIETISYFRLFVSPNIWFSLRFRYFSFDWKLWRKGLLIKFKDGRVYFIGVKNAENVKNEVNKMLFGTPST